MTFKKTILYFISINILIVGFFSIYTAYKPEKIVTEALVYQQFIDQKNSKILITKDGGHTNQTLYASDNILTYAYNGTDLLIARGDRQSDSKLFLKNLASNSEKEIILENKQITKILPAKESFVFLFDNMDNGFRTYKEKLGIYYIKTNQIVTPNPNLFASEITDLFINKQRTYILFTGFNNFKYIMDLSNLENVKRLDNKFNYTYGFSDETKIAGANFQSNEVIISDIVNDKNEIIKIGSEFFDSFAVDNSNRVIASVKYKDWDSKVNRLIDTAKVIDIKYQEYSLLKPLFDISNRYIVLNKTDLSIINQLKEFQNFYTTNQPIIIIDTKTGKIIDNKLNGVGFYW